MSWVKIGNFNTSDYDEIKISEISETNTTFSYVNSTTKGGTFLDFDSVENRAITIVLHIMGIDEEEGFPDLNKILTSNEQFLKFSTKPTLEQKGWFKSFSRAHINTVITEYRLEFELLPFAYGAKQSVTLQQNGTINVRGDFNSKPYIEIRGTGEITMAIGDTVNHFIVDEKISIECEDRLANVYDKNGELANSKMKGAFPFFVPGLNGISLSGDGFIDATFEFREVYYVC